MADRIYVVMVSKVYRETVEVEVVASNKGEAHRMALHEVRSGTAKDPYGNRITKKSWGAEPMEWETSE